MWTAAVRASSELSARSCERLRHASASRRLPAERQRCGMMPATDRNKPLNAEATPHLSYSRLQKYLTCPEQHRLHYIERFRAKVESASLVFGSVMHLALAEFFRHGNDPG